MAEDERTGDEAETSEEETGVGNKKKKWLIGGLVVLLLAAVSVAGTLYAIGFFSADKTADGTQEGSEQTEPKEQASAIYYPLKPEFITNFDVRGRQRYLQLEITLMLRDPDITAALELHMPAIRNALIMLLRGQVYEELQTPEGKELLRQQALLKVQKVLQQEIGKPGIEQVLFTNMVMQ